jgi:glycosyltransferase involved in cell wall biosynthesis
MNIVFLAREGARTGLAGGIATYTWVMAGALANQGHHVSVVAERPLDTCGGKGIEPQGSPEALFFPPRPSASSAVEHAPFPSPTGLDRAASAEQVTIRWVPTPPFSRTMPRRWPGIIYRNAIYSLVVARALAAMATQEGIDIVESPEWRSEALAYSYWPAAAPVVLRLHTPRFVERTVNGRRRGIGDAIMEAGEDRLAHRAAQITAPSASLATLAARAWRLPLEQIAVIPNPIDASFFHPATDTSRRSAGVDEAERPTILYVGRLEWRKGVDLLIAALPAIVAVCPQVRLELVGADMGAPGAFAAAHASMREALGARATALGVAGHVVFHGKLDPAAVRDCYQRATVCAIPSRYEGFGYTCLEAMACGCPVIAANTGGLADILAPGDCGQLVPPEDPAALADALIHALRHPEEAARWGQRARTRVERVYTADAVATRMSILYEEVLRRASPRRQARPRGDSRGHPARLFESSLHW